MARISGKYIAWRFLVSVFTIYVLATLLFVLLHAMPGSAIDSMISPGMSDQQIENLRERFGLDQPLYLQYWEFIVSYLTFDFGTSTTTFEPVSERVIERIIPTLVLFVPAFVLQYAFGTIAGMYLGWKRGTRTDLFGFTGGLFMYSIPFFWLGWILLGIFSFRLGWFPGGNMLPQFQSDFTALEGTLSLLWHLTIPVLSLAIIGWAGPMIIMRTTMQDVVNAEYVDFARAQGYSESAVMTKYGARNALIPVTTQAIIGIAFIIDGSVIVETVFSWPGLGDLLVDAIFSRDMPTALAAFFMLGVLIVVLRFITDIVYTFLDPRIEFGGSN